MNSQKYKTMNTIVVDKSGEELIKIISDSVGRMLRRKMDAVRCILKAAETAAEEYDPDVAENITYVSGKYSNFTGSSDAPEIPENMQANASIYRYCNQSSTNACENLIGNKTEIHLFAGCSIYRK